MKEQKSKKENMTKKNAIKTNENTSRKSTEQNKNVGTKLGKNKRQHKHNPNCKENDAEAQEKKNNQSSIEIQEEKIDVKQEDSIMRVADEKSNTASQKDKNEKSEKKCSKEYKEEIKIKNITNDKELAKVDEQKIEAIEETFENGEQNSQQDGHVSKEVTDVDKHVERQAEHDESCVSKNEATNAEKHADKKEVTDVDKHAERQAEHDESQNDKLSVTKQEDKNKIMQEGNEQIKKPKLETNNIFGVSNSLLKSQVFADKGDAQILETKKSIFLTDNPTQKSSKSSPFLSSSIKMTKVETEETEKNKESEIFKSVAALFKFNNKKWEKIGNGTIYVYEKECKKLVFIREGLMTVSFNYDVNKNMKPYLKNQGVGFLPPTGVPILLFFDDTKEQNEFYSLINLE